MQKKTFLITATLALLLGLSACGDKKTAAGDGNTSGSTSAAATSAKDVDAVKVVNSYVKAHNDLSGMFYGPHKGLETLLDAYKAQKLSTKTVDDPRLYLNVSMVRNSIESLEKAQASKLGGDYAKLEEVGARMLPNAKDLFKQAETLDAYIKSKKYTEDGFALFKAENDSFIKRWEQFNADAQALSDEIGVVEHQRRLEKIKAHEKAGDMLGMYREQSMLLASEVLELVAASDGLKNAEKIKTVDAKIAELEATLAKLKTEMDKSPEATSEQNVKTVHDRLNQMIGYWRELKTKKDARAFDNMIDAYNWAIR